MVQLSSALKAKLLTDAGIFEVMNDGMIDIYTGAPPPSADEPPVGTRVARITTNGADVTYIPFTSGLVLNTSVPGELTSSGNWIVKGSATGTAGWWRWKADQHDTNTQSTTLYRMDGIVGETLYLLDVNITPATSVAIELFKLTLG